MDPDDFEEFVEAALKQQQQQPQPQQKVIVQRNSPPILFPGGGPLTLNATSSLLVPNSSPIQAQPAPPQQLSFGNVAATVGGSSLVDATSVIVLNKDSSLAPMTIPINVVTAAVDQSQQQQPSSQFMQKVVMAAAAAGPSGPGSVQLMPAGTMKTLQQKMQTPGFKLQIGNTNIMSLQQKLITTTPIVNPHLQQQQPPQLSAQPAHVVGPPTVTMIQSSPSPSNPPTLTLPGPVGRLPSSIKILKPIAPKPVINYTSTVIKPAQTQEVANSGAAAATAGAGTGGPSSVCHHVLPFGTTIKVTAGNEQLPMLKGQQLIQAAASLQQSQLQPGPPPLPQLVPTQPQSPQTTQLLKQIRPASPAAATIVPQQSAVLSPNNQNKVIINKILYKPADSQVAASRIVSTGNGTPPLSPVSMPDLKRKIIISGPQPSAVSQRQIVQSSNAVSLPRIDHLPTNVQAVLNSCTNNSSITVTPLVTPVAAPVKEPEPPQSTQPEPTSDVVQIASNSTVGDASEEEVSSTTTEQLLISAGVLQSQETLNSSDLVISAEEDDDDEEVEQEEMLQKIVNEEERPKTPVEQEVTLEDLLNEQIKSPRLQKRANSEYQQAPVAVPTRRLSEPIQQEVVPEVPPEDEIPPMPKPLSVIKKSGRSSSVSRRSSSTKTIHSSLLCSEKFEMSSDESRSIKTSASSLHTISPPKKEETSSESPPAYDQDKLQTAIQNYKKSMGGGGKKSRSESRSVKGGGDAKDEDKDDKEFMDGDIGSTPSDLIKWDDGIGYIKNSYLHFQFNQYGLVEPMETKEYLKHVKTNVYESVKDPLQTRITASGRNKRKVLASEMSYRCRGCKCRGTASEFATPDYCSVACMKQTKNEPLLTSIARSKKLQRKGVASSESESAVSNNTPLPTSDDDSLASSLNFTNAFKEKNIIPKREPAPEPEPKFAWESYLAHTKGTPSPLNLFVNPYPSGTNKFRPGMKLEAIDPENNSLFCVCTIMEVRGYRMQLTFDGYSRDYDFWVNADSLDIFPPGWCRKTGRVLQPPKGYDENFRWLEYLTKTRSMAASRYLFAHLNATQSDSDKNKFEVGMSLEADDLKKSGKVCVASVTDKIDNRILVHFDGWDERYDYWVDIRSPYIHHINWHQENGYSITAPPDWTKGDFDWAKYIRIKSRRIGRPIIPADKTLFETREPMNFRPDMKLEVVDRKNQMLIRPATVIETDGYEIKVCFDGWPNFYSFWIEDDSPDIHPMNWCKRTAHPIEFPPNYRPASIKSTCEIPFCLGQGNAKFLSHRNHTRVGECPYRTNNWLLEDRKQLRVTHEQIVTTNGHDPSPESAAPPPTTPTAGAIQSDVPPPKKIKKELDDSTPAALPVTRSSPAVLVGGSQQEPPTSSTFTTTNAALDPLVKTALPVITDFGPRLKQSYRLWKASSRILDRCTDGMSEYDRNPLRWSVDEVATYVERFPGCGLVGGQIREEQINGAAFLSLTQDDLVKYLDVKLGPAIKLYNRIIHLRLEVEKHFLKF
uniref:Putative polycomb group protein scm/l3mbt tumor-supressor in n=1 Tax=Culex tarsalis TaxID=7177 RepID=A0A1Q3G1G5_CULTA